MKTEMNNNIEFDLLDVQLFPEDPIVDEILKDEEELDLTEIFQKKNNNEYKN